MYPICEMSGKRGGVKFLLQRKDEGALKVKENVRQYLNAPYTCNIDQASFLSKHLGIFDGVFGKQTRNCYEN